MKKSILITGCSSGIGKYCAIKLHERGYRVFATARKTEDVEALKALGLEALVLDLDNSTSINNAVNHVIKQTEGKLYAVFNNGAYGQPGAVEDLTRAVLRKQFETNLFGWLELTNLLIPHMRKYNQGRIIQNSSVLGLVALPFRGAYNASKFALEGLSDTLRMELRNTNIQVSLIEPGPIESAFRKNALAAFLDNVNVEQSIFRDEYEQAINRLQSEKSTDRFALEPQAVYHKLLHALEARKAKSRYYVTFPTHLMGFLRRFLPTRLLDKMLAKSV